MKSWISLGLLFVSAGYFLLSIVPAAGIIVKRRQIPSLRVNFPNLLMDFYDGFLGGEVYQVSLISPIVAFVFVLLSGGIYLACGLIDK